MSKELTYFKACVVCMHLVANGEYNDGTDAAEKCAEGQQRLWGDNAGWFMLAGCDEDSHCAAALVDPDHECQDFQRGFSWSACEGCGDEHGGDRFLLAVFE